MSDQKIITHQDVIDKLQERIAALEKLAKDRQEYLWSLTGDLWPQNETTKELERYLGEGKYE